MSPRKRKLISIAEKERKSSKRAKLLSNLWRSQEVEDRINSSNPSQSSFSSPVYNIKAIVQRRALQYPKDQVDNSSTGEAFSQVLVRALASLLPQLRTCSSSFDLTSSAQRLTSTISHQNQIRRRNYLEVSGLNAHLSHKKRVNCLKDKDGRETSV